MEKYAILGYPLKHTMSPPIHKKLFELEGKDGIEYEICEYAPKRLQKRQAISTRSTAIISQFRSRWI